MCVVNRVLMKLQEQEKKDFEMEDLLFKGVQEESLGIEFIFEIQDEL